MRIHSKSRRDRPGGKGSSPKGDPHRVGQNRPARQDSRPAQQPGEPHAAPPTAAGSLNPGVARHLLIYGIHPVEAAWLNPERRGLRLFGTAAALGEFAPTLDRAKAEGLKRPEPIALDRDALDRLVPQGAVHQGLALAAEPLPEQGLDDILIALGDAPATLVVLDQVTDPHNVGAILRSAAAFGATAMVLQRRHAPEVTGLLAKSASGAVEHVPILRETNLSRALEALRDAGFQAIGLDERGETDIAAADMGTRTALVLGAEGAGLRRLVAENCSLIARLPTQPPIGSLNVSNAAAVALYEIARHRRV